MSKFDGIKVFSATMGKDRADLGERITQWIADHAHQVDVVDIVVRQSSDHSFHCLSITLFTLQKRGTPGGAKKR